MNVRHKLRLHWQRLLVPSKKSQISQYHASFVPDGIAFLCRHSFDLPSGLVPECIDTEAHLLIYPKVLFLSILKGVFPRSWCLGNPIHSVSYRRDSEKGVDGIHETSSRPPTVLRNPVLTQRLNIGSALRRLNVSIDLKHHSPPRERCAHTESPGRSVVLPSPVPSWFTSSPCPAPLTFSCRFYCKAAS